MDITLLYFYINPLLFNIYGINTNNNHLLFVFIQIILK